MLACIKNPLLRVIFLLTAILITIDAESCTSFVVKKGEYQFLAKNFDWFSGEGYLILNRSGVEKYAFGPDSLQINWVSRYESLTFNHMGIEFPLGGMNVKGLVIEELNAPSGERIMENNRSLNELQWIQYQLDNHATVREVIESINELKIRQDLFSIHYLLFDRSGNIAIIEIINGRLVYYTGSEIIYPVLSNNLYGNLLKYIKNFKGFGGDISIQNHRDSQSRFVTIVDILENKIAVDIKSDYVFTMLDSVRQNDTKWSIIYDNINGIIYFKTSLTKDPLVFKFSDIKEGYKNIPYFIDLCDADNHSSVFRIFTIADNMNLYKKVLNDYSDEAGSESPLIKIIQEIFKFGNSDHDNSKFRITS